METIMKTSCKPSLRVFLRPAAKQLSSRLVSTLLAPAPLRRALTLSVTGRFCSQEDI